MFRELIRLMLKQPCLYLWKQSEKKVINYPVFCYHDNANIHIFYKASEIKEMKISISGLSFRYENQAKRVV